MQQVTLGPIGARSLHLTARLSAIVAFVLCMAWVGVAKADPYGLVTLDFREDADEVPTHLCIVSAAKSPRTDRRLSELLVGSSGADAARQGGDELIDPQLWGGDAQWMQTQQCAKDPKDPNAPIGDCRPRVELPTGLGSAADYHVACTTDTLTKRSDSGQARPLFVLLEHLGGSPPLVDSIRLTGGVATVGLIGVDFDHVVVAARSIGGYYLPDNRSERGVNESGDTARRADTAQRRIQLHLRPRCRTVEVRLPRVRIKSSDQERLSVRAHGVELDVGRCVTHLVGTDVIQVRMPPAPLGVGSLDLELGPKPDGSSGARFGADFEGDWPPTPFRLTFHQVRFTWRGPACIYPKDGCPTATLQTGTTCSATSIAQKTGPALCAYSCPGELSDRGTLDLVLPLEVTFEKDDPKQRWNDRLAQNGQELASYVPSDQVYLTANVHRWKTRVPDNEIDAIEVFGENGEPRRYGVAHFDRLLLRVPGATCEPLRVQVVGARTYREGLASVSDGQLEFNQKDPHKYTRPWQFNVALLFGGGPAWSSGREGSPPLYFSGLGSFGMEFRVPKPGWQRVGGEIKFVTMLGRWGTRQITTEDDATGQQEIQEIEDKPFGWARFMGEGGIVISLHKHIALGTALGLGVSLPIRQTSAASQNLLRFIYSPSIDARVRLSRHFRLVLQLRGIFGERAITEKEEDTTAGMMSALEQSDASAQSLLGLLGVQASF